MRALRSLTLRQAGGCGKQLRYVWKAITIPLTGFRSALNFAVHEEGRVAYSWAARDRC